MHIIYLFPWYMNTNMVKKKSNLHNNISKMFAYNSNHSYTNHFRNNFCNNIVTLRFIHHFRFHYNSCFHMWQLWQREIFYDVILRSPASVPTFSLLFFLPHSPFHSPIDVIILWNPVCCTLAWHNRSLRSQFTLMQPCRKCTRNIWCNKGRRISGRMTNVQPLVRRSSPWTWLAFRFVSFHFCETMEQFELKSSVKYRRAFHKIWI